MTEQNKTPENNEQLEKKVNRLSSTEVIKAEPITMDKNTTEEDFNKLFPNIEGGRYTGQSSVNSLVADDKTPFEIELLDGKAEIIHRVQKTTILEEGKKAFSSPSISNKLQVICKQGGSKTIANLLITPENKSDVFQLIKAGKAQGITSHWAGKEGKPLTAPNSERVIAKLEIVPFAEKASQVAKEATLEAKVN